MKTSTPIMILALICWLLPAFAVAQVPIPAPPQNEPHYPPPAVDVGPAHPVIPSHTELADGYNSGFYSLNDMRSFGLSVFATPFNSYDGLGDGAFWPAAEPDPMMPGQRASLQGNGMFTRLNGMDAQNCNECHEVVSNRTRIPTLGIGGVGGISDNAMPGPSLIDMADSTDPRVRFAPHPNLPFVRDGVADYNGRFINPPFLFGGGGVELLAKEMTADLQEILKHAENRPGTYVLNTHGVNFGYLISDLWGNVDFDHVVGVDEDLVVKPFGRKGDRFSMRDFDRGAMNFHFGIQPVEFLKANDLPPDDDGDHYVDEITVGEMSALHFFGVCNPRPKIQFFATEAEKENVEEGKALAESLGCFECHRPFLITRDRALPLAFEEIPEDPYANVYAKIDLVDDLDFDPWGNEAIIPLFADLKRHNMGERLKETADGGEVSNYEFTTARLWGIADTAPYLHDGRATTLYQAIWFHDGEAAAARDWFINDLTPWQQSLILWFLKSLRTPEQPNEDLLPLVLPN